MLNKKQIKRLEDRLDRRSLSIEIAYHAIDRINQEDLSEEEKKGELIKRLDRIHDYSIEIRTIKDILSNLGYKAEPNTDETGIDHYSIERI
jgi:hypothetical protein